MRFLAKPLQVQTAGTLRNFPPGHSLAVNPLAGVTSSKGAYDNLRDVGVAGSNPVTPTTKTGHFSVTIEPDQGKIRLRKSTISPVGGAGLEVGDNETLSRRAEATTTGRIANRRHNHMNILSKD
jgi:hypothetical protein